MLAHGLQSIMLAELEILILITIAFHLNGPLSHDKVQKWDGYQGYSKSGNNIF